MTDKQILCPWCMQIKIISEKGICSKCYNHLDSLEQKNWHNYQTSNYAELMALAIKIDTAFQFSEKSSDSESVLKQFHQSRIRCVLEMFKQLNNTTFKPITSEELEQYKHLIKEYSEQIRTDEELNQFSIVLRQKLSTNNPQLQNIDTTFFSFWCGEEILDWSYFQYFEIITGNLKFLIPIEKLIEIMQKHFPVISSNPIKQLN
ncbi:hypothetical protein [Listeria welshimeri]|uniref:hypothetical protein n=1 Tax=Listeria welshimeri TaxID=1643 RepID=UPI001888A114|nr:hypothetical protein [Listeria welshimeri]MBF2461049.1 hypothetical protein [Listeria welshimeri]